MFDLNAVQAAVRESGCDGWLLYDFRGLNVLAQRVVGLAGKKSLLSRRWFYFVPATGEPKKLVHTIEPASLDHLPGSKTTYRRWQELEAGVGALLSGAKKVAMEYSPRNANPYISRVDAGTVELVRSFGCEVVPSGDLIQLFEAVWDADQEKSHFEAAKLCRAAYDVAFAFIADEVKAKGKVMETAVQARILKHFADNGMTTYSPPIVGVGPHSGDPHFDTSPATDMPIEKGSFVLIDLWAKMDRPRAVYADYTRTLFVGDVVPEKYTKVFNVVAAARDAGIKCVKDAFAAKRQLRGWEVDNATRAVIEAAGYGDQYTHRTGHNIGQEVHGNGAHIDGLETRDDRLIIPRTCFSIEPGIYLPEFGVRSEVDVYIDAAGTVHVTGGDLQTEIHRIVV
ncbi:peptidase m24 : Peptidase M24 OS=Planctomyces limnophilus (strain ATCC 43296 / DSM 3776 / IFAM 1008 / 290) GN=Plim_0332 PE=4 SV=1: Peptidase_M24 [Gemmataceae bacterium]|nr:peptidase m24 : Peptidase M24 OS=Planctomyces limnophilus (strain ATCC 43296 / DSM 3776 / IFAM 1008 / 290) GN=Plim_0332 PE=4 SV=1: Peptidase_M24 [Gemmataceae bacterium]VTT97825.1 peptidase m24 : Peptidase M24 OS=Planctomyces limnophilus (strain ATCC 43296 / DSM 3776 / IFAM 1008 / 290) GN=Plim_0332 PE=4 SV=1: Peptidase_M24 [Gemmataceae bacterium]